MGMIRLSHSLIHEHLHVLYICLQNYSKQNSSFSCWVDVIKISVSQPNLYFDQMFSYLVKICKFVINVVIIFFYTYQSCKTVPGSIHHSVVNEISH